MLPSHPFLSHSRSEAGSFLYANMVQLVRKKTIRIERLNIRSVKYLQKLAYDFSNRTLWLTLSNVFCSAWSVK